MFAVDEVGGRIVVDAILSKVSSTPGGCIIFFASCITCEVFIESLDRQERRFAEGHVASLDGVGDGRLPTIEGPEENDFPQDKSWSYEVSLVPVALSKRHSDGAK